MELLYKGILKGYDKKYLINKVYMLVCGLIKNK